MKTRAVRQDPIATPNLADAANQQQTARQKRLAAGGRNSTFLDQTQKAALADRAPATLTGLSGLGGGAGGV